jgi:hypothetical protein
MSGQSLCAEGMIRIARIVSAVKKFPPKKAFLASIARQWVL